VVTSSSTRRMIGGIEETSASSEARSAPRSYPTWLCKNSTRYNRTRNFGLHSHAESKKMQKFIFRSPLRPNQISFSYGQDPKAKSGKADGDSIADGGRPYVQRDPPKPLHVACKSVLMAKTTLSAGARVQRTPIASGDRQPAQARGRGHHRSGDNRLSGASSISNFHS
jgi:hypothetical protein